MEEIKDFELKEDMKASELLDEMGDLGGFQGNKVKRGVDILERMIEDEESLNFLAFPACLISTGARGIIKEMVKRNWFDVIITTCGTLDHDLAKSFGSYYKGSFQMDDKEVKEEGYSRLGNVLVPNKVYSDELEERLQTWFAEIHKEKKELSTYELIWELGRRLESKDSIMYWAHENEVPVIVPGITDGMVGYQLWMFSQDKDLKIDVLKDEQLLNDKVWEAEKSGAFIIGGGISKHHTIWWNQFKNGLDYAVYLTTANEFDGSLSGAKAREAVSWNKIKKEADYTTIMAEATTVLPLMISGLMSKL